MEDQPFQPKNGSIFLLKIL